MRSIVLALCLAVVAAAPQKWSTLTKAKNVDASFEQTPFHKKAYKEVWSDFKEKHNKLYETVEEEIKRFRIFVDNMKTIEMHNYLHSKGQKSYKLGLNEYADLEHEEFVGVMNGYKMNSKNTKATSKVTFLAPSHILLPESVDWRTEGYVTPVKNQGQCGSCWAFSTTGSLEGQHYRKTGKLVSLSEQNLVDCSRSFGNNGCEGGLMDNAFQYIKENHGIDTEKAYPYKAEDLKCHFKKKSVGANDTGYVDVTSGDEDALQKALASVGPISIAIDASHRSFQLYDSGVYDEPMCSSSQLDHGVLTVGYGTSEEGLDYWIVKNSWGPTWGVDGYVMMSRNKENQCGVATQASYPLV